MPAYDRAHNPQQLGIAAQKQRHRALMMLLGAQSRREMLRSRFGVTAVGRYLER